MEIVQENCTPKKEGEQEEDLFKASFKKFKLSKDPTSFFPQQGKQQNGTSTSSDNKDNKVNVREILVDPTNGVVNSIQDDPEEWDKLLQERCIKDIKTDDDGGRMTDRAKRLGLRVPISSWKVFDLKFPKGLILIKNPFTIEGQRRWIKQSVMDFPFNASHITNIDNLDIIKEGKSTKNDTKNKALDRDVFYKKLRWITFGYHHNWDTKVYSEDSKCEFPPDLADLTKFMADILGFPDFKAEAAIANYYHLDSTLSGHVDRSEAYQDAPLFSLSFGQPAVFLIGGQSKSVKPQAIILQSGDVAIMSGESRLSYHGVPKIFQTKDEPWTVVSANNASTDSPSSNKRPKLDHFDTVDWNDFLSSYVCKSRINLNIRQVLFPGQKGLDE